MNQRIGAIQGLRALAANLVVVDHLIGFQSRIYPILQAYLDIGHDLGRLGVDIFFLISGFVISRVALKENAKTFLYLRSVRIYPIYWIYLCLTIAILAIKQPGALTIEQYFPAVFLYPSNVVPIVSVAWSLTFEVYFYTVVAIMIAIRSNIKFGYVIWALATIIIIYLGGHSFLGSVNTLEFIGGGILSLVAGAWADSALSKIRCPTWLQMLGDASYSTYLSHMLVVSILGRMLASVGFSQWILPSIICVLAANIFGLASYYFLEKPMMKFARATQNKWMPLRLPQV